MLVDLFDVVDIDDTLGQLLQHLAQYQATRHTFGRVHSSDLLCAVVLTYHLGGSLALPLGFPKVDNRRELLALLVARRMVINASRWHLVVANPVERTGEH